MEGKYILAIVFFIFVSACTQNELLIEPLFIVESINGGETKSSKDFVKGDYYIVTGFNESNEQLRQIDRFVCINRVSDLNNYRTYSINFYRKSVITNSDNLRKNPRDFDRYSNISDRLFKYKWTNYGLEIDTFVSKKIWYNHEGNSKRETPFRCSKS